MRLSDGLDWTFDLLDIYLAEIDRVVKLYRLDIYPHRTEMITSERMMDAYSSVGVSINYPHWSFGRKFIKTGRLCKHGQQRLAYEIAINSNLYIAYLMGENAVTVQALVMAHAYYGHDSFFKNSYLFQSWTGASSIVDYLIFARSYITQCEERYGVNGVEELLDSCHALMDYGVDRYKRPQKISLQGEKAHQKSRKEYLQGQMNMLWRTPLKKEGEKTVAEAWRYPSEPQESLLYFMEKNASLLEFWQREVLCIVRRVSQYFYPQKQTQVMNEDWATFWHYTILNHFCDEGKVTERFMLGFLRSHTSVVLQPSYNNPWYNGVNPYALGFAMLQDIKRVCQLPTEEDRYRFPDIAGSDWLETLHFAMRNLKDESFISQFLSPKAVRDFRLFTVLDDNRHNYLEISTIHNEEGHRETRSRLSSQCNLSNLEPNIQIWNVDLHGDRSLTLHYIPHNHAPPDKGCKEVLKHVYRLWGFDVMPEQQNEDGSVGLLERCPLGMNGL